MLPIKLEIEGLYSYKEKQVIDFETLTSSWLFGIFGKIGSGKSSIIDAITLAIYGKVERLGGNDNKNYNLMNLESNQLLIDFECKINNEYYKFRYLSKRNKKHLDKVNSPKVVNSILENGKWIPIDKNGEEILNISYRNFRQAVIIPQGKFQEFISQPPKERTSMLSEIFNLKKYDLSGNVKKLLSQTKEKKIRIDTFLSDIPEVNKELLNEKKELLIKYKKNIENVKKNAEILDKNKIKLLAAKEIFNDYLKTLDNYNKYKIINDNLFSIKEKIIIFKEIKPLIEENNKISIKLEEKKKTLVNLKKENELKEIELKKLKEKFKKLKLKEINIEKRYIFIEDFKIILEINDLTEHIVKNKSLKIKFENNIRNLITEKNIIENLLEKIEYNKYAFKDKINSFSFIDDLKDWHFRNTSLLRDLLSLSEKSALLNNEINLLKYDKIKFLKQLKDDNSLLNNKNKLEDKISKLNLHYKLSSFTKEIKKGENCPLCGSLEHPRILKLNDVTLDLEEAKKNLKDLKKEIENNKKLENDIELISSKIDFNLAKLNDNEKNIKKLNKELSDLKNNFKWSEIYKRKEYLDKLKEEKSEIESKILKVELEIKNNNKNKEIIKNKIQKNEIDLSKVTTKLNLKQENLDILINKLKKINYKDYLNTETKEINAHINKYQQEIDNYNKENNELINSIREIKNEINIIKSKLPQLASDIYDLKLELSDSESKLKSVYNETGLDEYYISPILKEKFNLKQRIQEVKDADKNFNIFKFKLDELIEKKSKNNYSEDKFLENKKMVSENKEEFENLINKIANLGNEIKINENNLIKFEKNIKEKKEITNRLNNLIILEKLFKGQKFVEYVANFYLKALIANANKRFLKLTKSQLGLEIDENGNFIVKDFLNAGRIRLLKTLSGGQTFQASFCIALALAESISILNKQNDDFFFIDEGFGSLDKDSLRLIFDTLNTLRYEKRIVGIISHVEEFKREVDISISIKIDKKLGSIINTSW